MADPASQPRQLTLFDIPACRDSCPELIKKHRQEIAKQWLAASQPSQPEQPSQMRQDARQRALLLRLASASDPLADPLLRDLARREVASR